jgi:tRNA dimethylallyltransferase
MTISKANEGKIYFVVGPTASGKTKLAIDLAKKHNGEVVSADSRQIYRDLNLSTGKVTQKEMEGIPHHMLDILNPGEDFSVVAYTDQALGIIEEIFSRGKTPIVCGGTGFYIDNLLYDYGLPPTSKDEDLRKVLESKTKEELFTELKALDPAFAKKIDKDNKVRLVRALEIAKSLGSVPPLQKTLRFQNYKIVFTDLDRSKVRENISRRLDERIKEGMIEEIKAVKEKYRLSDKYLEGLGLEFRWVNRFLIGVIDKQVMRHMLYIDICKYARRQDGWFRRYKN